ncbi:uncharacterized protein LOC122233769 isoform X3 [Panthera tigris]|uniref:uncharacterized protein LOC122233769 isoform X3 n=1 Tax=Panthera tigris TaxID=9694 RepID=UPI001C6F8AAB|nr:uncharacterized protein LOC122233769 isoform X3 [Panthera tigris]
MRPGRSGHCNRGPEVPCCPGQEGQGWGRGRRRPPSPPQRRQAHSYQADGEGAPGKRVGSRVHSRTRGRCSGTLRQMPLPRGRAWIGGCQGPGASIYLKPALRLGSQFTRSFNKHGALAGDQTAAMSAASLAEPTGSSASGRTKVTAREDGNANYRTVAIISPRAHTSRHHVVRLEAMRPSGRNNV